MKIDYRIFDPTGNITILVETPVLISEQPRVSQMLCEKEPLAEQVGFIQEGDFESDIMLRMAGGEFCGNATMCAAVYFCEKEGISEGEEKVVSVKVSGSPYPVRVNICKNDGIYAGFVSMPRPVKIYMEDLRFEGNLFRLPVVDFGGISHIIVEESMSVLFAEQVIKKWCSDLRAAGLGLMLLNKEKTELKPLVYIPGADTLYWESSCASGTTAVGAFLAARDRKDIHLELLEPGGVLTIDAQKDGYLVLGGHVIPIS